MNPKFQSIHVFYRRIRRVPIVTLKLDFYPQFRFYLLQCSHVAFQNTSQVFVAISACSDLGTITINTPVPTPLNIFNTPYEQPSDFEPV